MDSYLGADDDLAAGFAPWLNQDDEAALHLAPTTKGRPADGDGPPDFFDLESMLVRPSSPSLARAGMPCRPREAPWPTALSTGGHRARVTWPPHPPAWPARVLAPRLISEPAPVPLPRTCPRQRPPSATPRSMPARPRPRARAARPRLRPRRPPSTSETRSRGRASSSGPSSPSRSSTRRCRRRLPTRPLRPRPRPRPSHRLSLRLRRVT
jgi:hypothetical protein